MGKNIIGKRKRDDQPASLKKSKITSAPKGHTAESVSKKSHSNPNSATKANTNGDKSHVSEKGTSAIERPDHLTIQIVTGSYERILHGVAATISLQDHDPPTKEEDTAEAEVQFTDSFLFAAHTSSIRCLAISPAAESTNKRLLATGSSDERINLYSVSTIPPAITNKPNGSNQSASKTTISVLPTTAAETSRNRSIGSLTHHDRAITALTFPSKTKLFSAAEDNTVAISRTRDWTMLSSIKAPIPKPQGRPSGDTAAGPGELPTGINSFAIHPSQRLMLSVGRREKAMRLWNLMTGKKAGVLTFDRALLGQVGEGMRFSLGEGRTVLWDSTGENFVVGFDRAAALFGIDCVAKAVIRAPSSLASSSSSSATAAQMSLPATKLQQMRFMPLPLTRTGETASVLAVSTDDGRVLFFSLATGSNGNNNNNDDDDSRKTEQSTKDLPLCQCIGELGGSRADMSGRVKDFDIVTLPSSSDSNDQGGCVIVTGNSDGSIRVWMLSAGDLNKMNESATTTAAATTASKKSPSADAIARIGTLKGKLETGNRITCLGAFVMDGKGDGSVEPVEAEESAQEDSSEEESD